MSQVPWRYEDLRELLRDEGLPAMVVDLDVLDANTARLGRIAEQYGKRLRVASKSVRVPELLRRILEVGGDHFQGLMCFSVPEAEFLHGQGFDDLLVAYPTVQARDLDAARRITEDGGRVTLMVDCPRHVELLAAYWRNGGVATPLAVCIDQDMSWRALGQHVGVQRSPVRGIEDFRAVLDAVVAAPELRLSGVMGYEAQIAGVGDDSPFAPLLNPVKRAMKQQSIEDVAVKRRAVAQLLAARGLTLDFVNGGGPGSIRTTSQEPSVTEVTAGSGFLQSHLFDYYAANENRPAFCFALQVTRCPEPGFVTCHSGGFVASGEPGPDKLPLPVLPEGRRTTRTEACGEVQTPVKVPPALVGRLGPGDPVFFRPAKAGEIAEHFAEYLLMSGGRIVGRAPTYRGLGRCFY
jgi:D-serine deaminase-like pyridoxal phosphate-dependent protein